MTFTYSTKVADAEKWGCFPGAMCYFSASLYKIIWRELISFMTIFMVLVLIVGFSLYEIKYQRFNAIQQVFERNKKDVPITFLLGFYLSHVMIRWWEMNQLLPNPVTLSMLVSSAIYGESDRCRLMRVTIVRYAVLSHILALRNFSTSIRKRFPSISSIAEAGLISDIEAIVLIKMHVASITAAYTVPLVWATNVINRARSEGNIADDDMVGALFSELAQHRRKLGKLINYYEVNLPMAYPQMVTLAVYSYLLLSLVSGVFAIYDETTFYEKIGSTIYTTLEFTFYHGLLKIAGVMLNPFGEDEEDFEVSKMIDRSLATAFMIVEDMRSEEPELEEELWYDVIVPRDWPYTKASLASKKDEHIYSTDDDFSIEHIYVELDNNEHPKKESVCFDNPEFIGDSYDDFHSKIHIERPEVIIYTEESIPKSEEHEYASIDYESVQKHSLDSSAGVSSPWYENAPTSQTIKKNALHSIEENLYDEILPFPSTSSSDEDEGNKISGTSPYDNPEFIGDSYYNFHSEIHIERPEVIIHTEESIPESEEHEYVSIDYESVQKHSLDSSPGVSSQRYENVPTSQTTRNALHRIEENLYDEILPFPSTSSSDEDEDNKTSVTSPTYENCKPKKYRFQPWKNLIKKKKSD